MHVDPDSASLPCRAVSLDGQHLIADVLDPLDVELVARPLAAPVDNPPQHTLMPR